MFKMLIEFEEIYLGIKLWLAIWTVATTQKSQFCSWVLAWAKLINDSHCDRIDFSIDQMMQHNHTVHLRQSTFFYNDRNQKSSFSHSRDLCPVSLGIFMYGFIFWKD